VAGNDDTNDNGTTTGDTHVDGIVTVAGTVTVTNDDSAIVTTAVDGTDAITLVGTESGTFDHSTIATLGDEATVKT